MCSLSVGHARLLSAFPSFFLCSRLDQNSLTSTIPSQMSTLTKLTSLYAPFLDQLIECWSYILLSVGLVCLFLTLSSFFYQGSWLRHERTSLQPTLGFHTCANICSGQIRISVRPQTVRKTVSGCWPLHLFLSSSSFFLP